MKKTLLLLCIIFLGGLFLSGCSLKKNALDSDSFRDITVRRGHNYLDITSQFEYDERIQSASLASSNFWHVEFYEFDSEESAMDTFESNRQSFEETKTSTSYEEENHSFHYDTYSLVTSYEYMYLCRVDKTLLFARVPIEYRDQVMRFIQQLGY